MSFIVKNTTFPSLLDLFVPHSCRGCGQIGEILCERCKNNIIEAHQNICPSCKTPTTELPCPNCDLPITYTISTRTDLLDELIHDFKYQSIRSLGKTFAEILDQVLPPLPKNSVIVPLPTSHKHIRERGIDHTKLIAKHLAKKRHIISQYLLLRAKDTVQVGSDRATRLAQAKDAYAINPKLHINKAATYVLLDDVWTTGASMKAAIKKLRLAGVKNIIIVLLAVSKSS